MQSKSWSLEAANIQGEKFSSKHSKSAKNMIEPLEKGHKVKLTFKINNGASNTQSSEQLWVELLLVQDNKFLGQLEDDPKLIKDLMRGEIIEFEEFHIVETD